MENNNLIDNSHSKTTAVISYLTIIGWLFAYFAFYREKKSAFAAYHLKQSLLLMIGALLADIMIDLIADMLAHATGLHLFTSINLILRLGLLTIWIICLVNAIKGEESKIPLLSEQSQKLFPFI